jgi:enamine deaminase RidA (YjgF/YER057c/UK114 family)
MASPSQRRPVPLLAPALVGLMALAAPAKVRSDVRKWNPETLFNSNDFSHLALSSGMKRSFYVSALGPDLPGDKVSAGVSLRDQTLRVLKNIDRALSKIGATTDDVVSMHTYVTNSTFLSGITVGREMRPFFKDRMPASTYVPVRSLIWPNAKIQVDLVIELPR